MFQRKGQSHGVKNSFLVGGGLSKFILNNLTRRFLLLAMEQIRGVKALVIENALKPLL
ncbi:hypothetical protein X474_10695 [Dethiosulfatarculus sandiegensis]|uniref:Uncharacterized protein n=1 Tax=Dethiosulfatarculus sandiegensis TaxID=1429043 RepID=A0A0D2HUH4_9BACT|nr:hypothetical protein X474_10695 [Dethiosulfatarculus sandiegensis]